MSPPLPAESGREPAVRPRGRASARLYKGLGFAMLGLAVAGVVLPGLPATPFLLVAAWAFRRGSPRLAARLDADPRFGPLLRNWRERRAVPRRAKIAAVLSMAASFAILVAGGSPTWALVLVGAILCCVSAYLLSRPDA